MATSTTPPRSPGLIALGALQIVLGLICALFVLSIASHSETALTRGAGGGAALASGLIVWGIATVYFVAAGVGSIRQRRWARALSVVVSAIWFCAGLLAMVVLPTLPGQGRPSLVAAFGAGVLLPLLIHLYYRRDVVRAACESADVPRWTDRVPLPVLAVVVVLAFGAVTLVANLANPTMSFFGSTVTGAPAAVTLLALAVLSAWLAAQLYRLKESAWWTLIMLQVAGIAIAIASMIRTPSESARSPMFIAIVAGSWVVYFAYLLYIRRYFALRSVPRTRRDDAASSYTG